MGIQDRPLIVRPLRLARRPLAFLAVLCGITILNFVLIQAGGSGAMREIMLSETRLSPESVQERLADYRDEYGLDAPLHERFLIWAGRLVRLDLGRSMSEPGTVADILGPALGASLWLQIPAFLLIFVVGIPLGVRLARRKSRLDGRVLATTLYGLGAVPTFWLATLFLVYGATRAGLDLFPIEGLGEGGFGDRLMHLFLPVTALALPGIVVVARQTRQGMLEALDSAHVLALRALGMHERRIVWVHALRQALVPVAVLFGLLLPSIVGGSIAVELIFNVDGLGLLLLHAVKTRDMPVMQALVLLSSIVTLFGFVLADLLVGLLAPTTRELRS